MRTVKQSIFNDFKCIADKCPCTCCSGWQIMVDDASLGRFSLYEGKLAKNMKNSIDWEEGAILQCENGDCAFLNSNGLCDLIAAEGEDILCDTCRLYPRHVEEYEDLREWSMSLSCPEVTRLMLSLKGDVGYETVDDDEPDPLADEFDDFDIILFTKLLDSREVIFKILRNKELSVGAKAGLIIEFAERLQRLYDEDDVFMMDDIIKEFEEESFLKENAEEFEVRFSGFVREDFAVLDELERLDASFDKLLKLVDFYPYSTADATEDFIEGVSKEDHNKLFSRLLESLIYTYYPGAVYNGMIYGYTLMCIFGVIVMDSLALSKSIKDGRKISPEEYGEFVYRYSRETEHSDVNIGILLEYFDSKLA